MKRVGVGVDPGVLIEFERLTLAAAPPGCNKSWFCRSKWGTFGHVAPGGGPTSPLCPRRGSTLMSLLITWLDRYVWCRWWGHVSGVS